MDRVFVEATQHTVVMTVVRMVRIILAVIGAWAVLIALITWLIGYTWIGMPPGGGCWS